ncbi:protein FAR1-RELATED SEQUENCE 5-like [Nymphaea colorata]|uniref:protein FAR1-RELATED SEQUENCE 5-like n=1 Tax=Nymphaea colorata TaxID=210225 RepID=UPI00214EA42A|nr:protein FAR1-RELATED SEQUENCE 5-like [Nymphaea colorata]
MDTSSSSAGSNVAKKIHMGTSTSENVAEFETSKIMVTLKDDNRKVDEAINLDERCEAINDEIRGDEEMKDKKELVPNVSSEFVPYVGMEFDSDAKAYDFYNTYARLGGFDICIRDCKRKRGVMHWKQFCCKKNGFKKQKNNERKEYASTKCGCKAWMSIELVNKTKWRVRNIQYVHNHYLHSPSKMNFHKTTKNMNTLQKKMVDTETESGLRASQVLDVFAHQVGGMEHVTYSKKQLIDHLQKIQNTYYGKDCQTMLNYFKKQQDENPDFYYSIQVDEFGKVENCFWVDSRAREDYYYFGDVVLFDMTYKKNKYHMPFAPFIGVNHHSQSIIFGCALLVDEKKGTFKWLFQEWLHAMGGRAPMAFITDQNLVIKEVVVETFPDTVHRCCSWDILTEMPTSIGNLYKQNHEFKHLWDAWFFKSETIEEFENRWNEMINLYPQLKTTEWATNLWKERSLWAKPYSGDTFMAGMSMTQRSESMNDYFKQCIYAHTTLTEFIVKYEEAIHRQRSNEKELDFKMNNEVEPTNTSHPMEVHLRDIYTPEVFRKHFQDEFLAITTCTPLLKEHAGDVRVYTIKQVLKDCGRDGASPVFKEYTISFDKNTQNLSSCGCKLWKSLGVVCCHMLTVFNAEQLLKLPSTYILKRWTKHARKGVVQLRSTSQALSGANSSLMMKNILQLKANMCVNEALSSGCYEDAINGFDKLLQHLQNVKMHKSMPVINVHEEVQVSSNESAHMKALQNTDEDEHHDDALTNRETMHAKGSSERIISCIQQSKVQRSCKTCGQLGHNSRTCGMSMNARNISTDSEVGKQRICHSCRGTGHDKRNCPKLKHSGCTAAGDPIVRSSFELVPYEANPVVHSRFEVVPYEEG